MSLPSIVSGSKCYDFCMKNQLTRLSLILLISGFGCNNKSKDSDSDLSSAVTPLTTAQLQGTSTTACSLSPVILGTDYSTMSVQYSLTVNANESINYQISFYDSSNCAPGTEAYSFTQFGTITATGASSTIAGASNFSITLSNAVLTPLNANWVAKLNANCSYQSFALNSSKDVVGISCASSDASMSAISWPVSGTILYNSATLSAGTPQVLRLKIYTTDTYSIYKLGGAGYPATLTSDFTY